MKYVLWIACALLLMVGSAAALAPTITNPNCVNQPCSLTTGTNGIGYTFQLAATGGTPAYTWSYSLGTLTGCGLSLNASTGLISGIGITGGRIATIQVTDSIAQRATVHESVTITTPAIFGGAD